MITVLIFETDIVDDEGKPDTDRVSVNFCLEDNRGFARAYYRDELIKAGCDPDFQVKWYDDNKRNPRYYEEENKCDTWLGFVVHQTRTSQSLNQKQNGQEIKFG